MGPIRMDWHTYLTYLVHSYLQVKCSASLGVLGRKEAAVPDRTPALLSWWEQRIKICRQLHVCACVLCKAIEYWNKFSEQIFVNYYSRIILYIQVCMEKWIQVISTPLYGPQKSQIQRKSNKIKIESQQITKSIQILFDVIQDCTRYADAPIRPSRCPVGLRFSLRRQADSPRPLPRQAEAAVMGFGPSSVATRTVSPLGWPVTGVHLGYICVRDFWYSMSFSML